MNNDYSVNKDRKIKYGFNDQELAVQTYNNDRPWDDGKLPQNKMITKVFNKPVHNGIHFVTTVVNNDTSKGCINDVQYNKQERPNK